MISVSQLRLQSGTLSVDQKYLIQTQSNNLIIKSSKSSTILSELSPFVYALISMNAWLSCTKTLTNQKLNRNLFELWYLLLQAQSYSGRVISTQLLMLTTCNTVCKNSRMYSKHNSWQMTSKRWVFISSSSLRLDPKNNLTTLHWSMSKTSQLVCPKRTWKRSMQSNSVIGWLGLQLKGP